MSLLRTESIPRRGRGRSVAKEVKARPILPAHNLLQLERDAIHRVEFARRKREAEELAGETVNGLDLRDVTRYLTDEHALTPANIVGLHTAQQLRELRKDLAERRQKDSHRSAEPDVLDELAGEPEDALVQETKVIKTHKRPEPTPEQRDYGDLDEWFATPMKPVDLATVATPLMNATVPIDQGANDEVEQAVNSSIDDKFLDALDSFWTNPFPKYTDKSLDEKLRDSSEESFHSFITSTPKLAEQQIEPNSFTPTAPKSFTEKAADVASSAMASLWSAAGRVDNLNPLKKLGELFNDTRMEPIYEHEEEAVRPAPSKRAASEETIDETIKASLDNDGRPSEEEAAEAAEQEGQPAPAYPETDLNGDNDSAAGDEGESRAWTKEAKTAANKRERETRARLKGTFGEYHTLANYVQFKENTPGSIREPMLEALHKNPGLLTNLYRVGSAPLGRETAEFWKSYGTRYLKKSPDNISKDAKKSFVASWDKFRTEYPAWETQYGKGLDFDHRHERRHEYEHERRHEHEHEREHEHEHESYFPEREIQRVIDLRDRGQIDAARVYAMSLRSVLNSAQLNELLRYITGVKF